MALLGTLADDIMLRIYSGTVNDDTTLEKSQVMWWLMNVRDQITKDYLDLQIRNGKPIDTRYQIREVADAAEEDLADTEQSDERIFLTLEYQPMSLLNDVGVQRVLTQDGVMVNKTRNESIDWIKDLKYAKPSIKNPVWYRDDKKVILEGVSYKNPKSWIIYYIPTATSQNLGATDELVIGDELLPVLLETVTKIAQAEIYGSIQDTDNNGADDIKPQ